MVSLKKRIKIVLGALANTAGIYEREFKSRMIVTAFHRVNDVMPDDELTCTSKKFEAFCQFFSDHFRLVPFAEQVRGCAQRIDMGGTLSITLDDGYRDNFEIAAPILQKHKLPATFFVTTGFIGTDYVPLWDRALSPHPGWMTWDQVRNLSARGFDIGCHTDTHIDMGTAAPETVRAELALSKAKLQQELGKQIDLFVYPFGGVENISARSLELVREAGFVSCASCHGGANQPITDPYHINRVPIGDWFARPHQFGTELVMGKL
jgi:peptidoglycan/xylan/chitin deacetylase (PgdA/CDA1 family)